MEVIMKYTIKRIKPLLLILLIFALSLTMTACNNDSEYIPPDESDYTSTTTEDDSDISEDDYFDISEWYGTYEANYATLTISSHETEYSFSFEISRRFGDDISTISGYMELDPDNNMVAADDVFQFTLEDRFVRLESFDETRADYSGDYFKVEAGASGAAIGNPEDWYGWYYSDNGSLSLEESNAKNAIAYLLETEEGFTAGDVSLTAETSAQNKFYEFTRIDENTISVVDLEEEDSEAVIYKK
jgi:hypothetical protein